jgi:hypothetical protein
MTIDTTPIAALFAVMVFVSLVGIRLACVALASAYLNRRPAAQPGRKPSPTPPFVTLAGSH